MPARVVENWYFVTHGTKFFWNLAMVASFKFFFQLKEGEQL
jgi:hypothetical protein